MENNRNRISGDEEPLLPGIHLNKRSGHFGDPRATPGEVSWKEEPEMERTTDRSFDFLPINERGRKPRKTGITEMRGPDYAPVGKRYPQGIFETMGTYVDIFKFSGGSFRLMPKKAVKELIDTCHEHDVLVSTGGFIERGLTYGPDMVDRYLAEGRGAGVGVVEVSRGFISVPLDYLLGIVGGGQELGGKGG